MGNNRWFDKYFHWWQRKNVFDVYLEETKNIFNQRVELLVVVLTTGEKGKKVWFYSDNLIFNIGIKDKDKFQEAYKYAVDSKIPKSVSDYEKYLKPTLGTKRPDPDLISLEQRGW